MSNNLVAIIQARMMSGRLPGKVLLPIMEKPVLWHIVQRLKKVPMIDDVLDLMGKKPEMFRNKKNEYFNPM